MREFRVIAAIAIVALVFVIAGLISVDVFTDHDGMDRTASRHIEQICGFQRDCKGRIGDLVPGNWDTFYEFGVGVPQGEVDRVLGSNRVISATSSGLWC
jgi:hypothetical protein